MTNQQLRGGFTPRLIVIVTVALALGFAAPAKAQQQQCALANEEYLDCGSACPPTCANPAPQMCVKLCKAGCFCQAGFLRATDGSCVEASTCTATAATGTTSAGTSGTSGTTATIPTGTDCPPGVTTVSCLVNPCAAATCAADPAAKCVANYCGGCNAVFYNANGAKVDCAAKPDATTGSNTGCPAGVPLVNCFADPCSVTTCAADPTAKCVSNYCGGCNAVFYNANGAKVDCASKPVVPTTGTTACPPGVATVSCLVDPCAAATCAADPTAKCVSNYCGGCNAAFFNANGAKVDCAAQPACGANEVFSDCASACPASCADPAPMCTAQCVAACTCAPGFLRDDNDRCVTPKECPAPLPVDCSTVRCMAPPCDNAVVPAGQCCAVCPKPAIDCSTVMCAAVACANAVIPAGGCCPICQPEDPKPVDCSTMMCAAVACANAVVPAGGCCPVCPPEDPKPVDCSTVMCAAVACANAVIPAGTCCPICPPEDPKPVDCSTVRCMAPNCADPVKLPGQCCAVCPKPAVDCSTVMCAAVACANAVVPAGGCCPICPPEDPKPVDCSNMMCAMVACANAVIPAGGCCPVCPPENPKPVDCSTVMCAAVACANAVIPAGTCCPICPPEPVDCSTVRCMAPNCADPVKLPGQCCAVCPKPAVDCSTVMCAAVACANAVIPAGGCCPVCQPEDPKPVDCSAVACAALTCPDAFVPAGECCPVCPMDCKVVRCGAPPACADAFVPKGKCCPVCPTNDQLPKPDCSAVACLTVACANANPVIPPGQCCPVCPPEAEPACAANEAFSECGSSCPATCANPAPALCNAMCARGCFCKPGFLRTAEGRCVAPQDCPASSGGGSVGGGGIVGPSDGGSNTGSGSGGSTGGGVVVPSDGSKVCKANEVYTDCGSACPAKCGADPALACMAKCVAGCACKEGFLRTEDGRCVTPMECPVGGRDERGCLPGAGFTWCDAKRKCLRPWEEKCEVEPEYNCFTREVWAAEKKEWCCKNKNLGCGDECAASDCTGPSPLAAARLCPDGSAAGPVCKRGAAGTCEWKMTTCPTEPTTGPRVCCMAMPVCPVGYANVESCDASDATCRTITLCCNTIACKASQVRTAIDGVATAVSNGGAAAGGAQQLPIGAADANGCVPSAGFTWCAEKKKCLRSWEEQCGATAAAVLPGSTRDAYGCTRSAGETWCDAKQKCLRAWEEECVAATCQGATDGTRCDDGDRLTVGDHCVGGACVGRPVRERGPAIRTVLGGDLDQFDLNDWLAKVTAHFGLPSVDYIHVTSVSAGSVTVTHEFVVPSTPSAANTAVQPSALTTQYLTEASNPSSALASTTQIQTAAAAPAGAPSPSNSGSSVLLVSLICVGAFIVVATLAVALVVARKRSQQPRLPELSDEHADRLL